ncbi:MAG: sigma-70 family RNA polymerase sigma factor [Clostridiales bacterium]|nr:sigma-70 family RNA polymerase sigma factor [Clostridiales bacterium]
MFLEILSFLLAKITFFAGSIIGGGSFPKPLDKDEETECLIKMSQGDKSAKEKLINHNLRLVAHVVKKYTGSAETDDLISVGSIGLIKAINTYQVGKGTSLATYTARCIENEILMLLRANKKHRNDVYLSDPVGADKDGNELTLMDLLCDGEDEVFCAVDKSVQREKLVRTALKTLTKREYAVIRLRYGLDCERAYAQREVALFLKISRSYVSRIEKKAIEKLRVAIKKGDFYC